MPWGDDVNIHNSCWCFDLLHVFLEVGVFCTSTNGLLATVARKVALLTKY